MSNDTTSEKKASWFSRMVDRAMAAWYYVSQGVWEDKQQSWKIDVIKTLNLSARSFLNSDLQNKACALTYRMILAIVPALALLFAIARGFGFQNLLQTQLFKSFPAQQRVLETALGYVDSYLAQASEGIFVGVGIIFLLWTLISLLGYVESAFNAVWNIKDDRSMWRKLTDYTAICLVIPVLMICSSGISIFMSTTIPKTLPFLVKTPIISYMLDLASVVFCWLAFTGAYMLIPNTKVKFLNALIAGVLAGTGFLVLQWIFVSGQMYVSTYNAIYGSFSFLPLLLIWLQLVWLITLTGAVVCYSSQNIFRFSFEKQINTMSADYGRRVLLGVLAAIVQRFEKGEPPLNVNDLSKEYLLPPRLVDEIVNELITTGFITRVSNEEIPLQERPLQPTREMSGERVSEVLLQLSTFGSNDFIPDFDTIFPGVDAVIDAIDTELKDASSATLGSIKIVPTNKPSK